MGMTQDISILLIEDDPALLAAHWRFLRRTFPLAVVMTAETSSRAIAILATDIVTMVVSDYQLGWGGGTGADVLTWIRKHRPALVDRFVFLTGSPEMLDSLVDARVMLKGTPSALMREYLTGVLAGATV